MATSSLFRIGGKSVFFFSLAALSLGLGCILLSTHLLVIFGFKDSVTPAFYPALNACSLIVAGLVAAIVGYRLLPVLTEAQEQTVDETWRRFQRFQFGAHLCFLGYFLFLMGLCCLIVVVNLLRDDQLMVSGRFQSEKFAMVVTEWQACLDDQRALEQARASGEMAAAFSSLANKVAARKHSLARRIQEMKAELNVLLVLSCGLAVFGSMFFTINTLKEKRSAKEPEFFDQRRFWGELVFRCGEAVLFTILVFWLIWNSQTPQYYTWLPVMALFLGMFIKSAEQVIYGLSDKVLEKARLLLPFEPRKPFVRPETPKPTGATSPGTVAGDANVVAGAAVDVVAGSGH